MLRMYVPTVGLEIHAELKTVTKMFCASANQPDGSQPNVHICPVCVGHPGTLPTINKEAVRHVLRVGVAVGGTLADYSEFDRKNYFYPDLPKAYQLSQYEYPLVSGGELGGIALTRIHLEEDTARSLHEGDADTSLVDFNRSGVPLMELVTEPVVHSAEEAAAFARELQLLLRTLDASAANMEKGEMRVEANISVAQKGAPLGTKVEVKNLNSFRSVERAVRFEVARQTQLLERGERITQETRGWDEHAQKTFAQRTKEEAADYRYFPDPDLPKLKIRDIPEFAHDTLKASLPELPADKRKRLASEHALDADTIGTLVYDRELGDFFEAVIAHIQKEHDAQALTRLAANYLTNNLVALKDAAHEKVTAHITPAYFAEVVQMAHAGDISSNSAVALIAAGVRNEAGTRSPRDVASDEGLLQESETDALLPIVESIVREHKDVVAEYPNGKEQALQYLVGQGMKQTSGRANPAVLKQLIKDAVR